MTEKIDLKEIAARKPGTLQDVSYLEGWSTTHIMLTTAERDALVAALRKLMVPLHEVWMKQEFGIVDTEER